MNVIVWTNSSGSVSICTPTGELPIEEVKSKDTPADSVIVDTGTFPADVDFIDAWVLQGSVVSVDMGRAKEFTKKRLRAAREPLLQKLDVDFQRALESGIDPAPIVAEKQRLRDITKLPDACTSLDELRALHC
jgi:hypothetical protein